jgi:Spy/CpxP family protein refolding chaperone
VARPQQLAALFLVSAFLLGGAVGWTAGRVVVPRAEAAPAVSPARAVARDEEAGKLDEFAAELGLSTAQRAAVDSILDERRRVMDSLVAPLRPRLDAARDDARAQIRQRLTAEQRARFSAYLARQKSERPSSEPRR